MLYRCLFPGKTFPKEFNNTHASQPKTGCHDDPVPELKQVIPACLYLLCEPENISR